MTEPQLNRARRMLSDSTMDLRQLHIFATVAEHASFTKAAVELDFAQSHVTTQVRKLEDRIGVKLFVRGGRGVRLTEEGRTLLHYARRLQSLAREAEAAVTARTLRDSLSIVAHESLSAYRLPEILQRLHALAPDLDVHLSTLEEARMSYAALEGLVDVAFVYCSAEVKEQIGNHGIELSEERVAIVCAPELPLAQGRPLQLAGLSDVDALLAPRPCPSRSSFERMLKKDGTTLLRVREFPSAEAIKQCALRGLGFAVLPYLAVAGDIANGRLVELALPDTLEPISAMLVASRQHTAAVRTFIEASREVYADELNRTLRSVERSVPAR
jgi:DNA-binding transcriptional LysR family regulator